EVVTDGAKIEVTRISVTNVVKTVAIPFEKVTKKSADMNAGKQVIKQAGVNGKKNQTYQVTKKNGVVAGQKLMKEVVVAQPKAQITEHGTRKVMSSQGGGAYAVSRGAAPGAGAPARYRKVIDVVATAYSSELISNKWTATGAVARVGLIAVDPRVIPLGTRLYITSMDGKRWVYGYAVAADTGGAIKGNKIDLFFNTEAECYDFGRQKAKVYILD
ncbi:MAG: 3D domain-containing protein, partial [Clostridia bacterium]